MSAHSHPVRSHAGRQTHLTVVAPVRPGTVTAVPVPRTPLLACALPRVDWSDAYAVALPRHAPARPPEEWADAIFRAPPLAVRILFGAREVLVRLVGIQPGTRRAFDLVSWSPNEVLLGIDQKHLGFRASVLVQPDRVVVSTIVEVRNRRGRAYSALVRRVHPLVVRRTLAHAARQLAGRPVTGGSHVG
jgi:hypothetical protein